MELTARSKKPLLIMEQETQHFVFVYKSDKIKTLQRPVGSQMATLYCLRSLIVATVVLLSASDARRVVAEQSHPHGRVEIHVEDFSFSDQATKEEEYQQIAIEAHDLKGSELKPWVSTPDIHFITWEITTRDETRDWNYLDKNQVMDQEVIATIVEIQEDQQGGTVHGDNIVAVQTGDTTEREGDVLLTKYTDYRTAVWWWSQEKTQLSTQEQAVVLAAVVTILLVFGLALIVLWNMVWRVWRFYREIQTLHKLFGEQNPVVLEQELCNFPVELLSLRIKQIACVRLRHLQVVSNARDFKKQIEMVEFREIAMELVNLPLHPISRKEMTFAEILTTVEEIACRGEQVAVEMMQLVVPSRWKNYVDESSWLKTQDESLQSLHLENARVQQLSEQISELLVAKVNSNEAIPKPVFLSLLASLRQNLGTPPQNYANVNVASSELDAFARCWSGSMTMSGSVGNAGCNMNKDEFGFLLKAFDEVAEQQKVRQELLSAIENFQSVNEPEYEQLLLLENADSASRNQITQRTKQLGTTAAGSSGATAASMRRLERLVDEAEMMEMTYVEEVESAQFMLEDARRDSFCAAIVSSEGKGLDSVQSLATNFVALGAKREDAILKAGEILANRSNMMLLVTSLRGMFDQLRKRDIIKMNERRNRDRAKAQDKRNRMAQKFHNKQQLVIEKIERAREAQRQMEEEARLQRRKEELKQVRAQSARNRASFVWAITKTDVLVVLVIMAIVFFENLREVAFVKPLCQPDEEHHWWMVSWWAPASLQVFGCEVSYGMKILGILLALGVCFFAAAQLNLVAVLLPVLGAIGLYYLRAEWMNMLFRLPLLFIIYGFNSGILYLFNRFEDRSNDDHVVKEQDKDVAVSSTRRRNMLLASHRPLQQLRLYLQDCGNLYVEHIDCKPSGS
ncbi:unnamed protein product [Peronospora belbahrii]|uniref:Uncharacterized protein n=1 Tax=Peronospora belbahrii TaxID=622444 RepID=A0ABN8D1X7_9STRA|nr:unnamed protein product [Peronospora belbahrii]